MPRTAEEIVAHGVVMHDDHQMTTREALVIAYNAIELHHCPGRRQALAIIRALIANDVEIR